VAARDARAAARAAEELGIASHVQLDVSSPESVAACATRLRDEVGELHALVNNAGVHYDTGQRASRADLAIAQEALAVNVLGAWRTSVALLSLLTGGARIVNVSSGVGSFAESAVSASTPAYAVSKAALNMLTVNDRDQLAVAVLDLRFQRAAGPSLRRWRRRRPPRGAVQRLYARAAAVLDAEDAKREAGMAVFLEEFRTQWHADAEASARPPLTPAQAWPGRWPRVRG